MIVIKTSIGAVFVQPEEVVMIVPAVGSCKLLTKGAAIDLPGTTAEEVARNVMEALGEELRAGDAPRVCGVILPGGGRVA